MSIIAAAQPNRQPTTTIHPDLAAAFLAGVLTGRQAERDKAASRAGIEARIYDGPPTQDQLAVDLAAMGMYTLRLAGRTDEEIRGQVEALSGCVEVVHAGEPATFAAPHREAYVVIRTDSVERLYELGRLCEQARGEAVD